MSYRDLFQKLNTEGIRYVVPRRYDSLPESTVEGGRDVDILVESSQFQAAVNLCNTLDFVPEENSGPSRLRVYRMALAKPQKAFRRLVWEPKESIRKIFMGREVKFENPRHKNAQLYRDSQVIDLRNNLAYKSPMDGARIPVDPAVTVGMLDRRKKESCFYIPTVADELAHLIPHCVFNKDGEFPPYYADRCEELFIAIRSDNEQLELFRNLLEKIFFKADQLVFELITENRYSEIRNELEEFSEY